MERMENIAKKLKATALIALILAAVGIFVVGFTVLFYVDTGQAAILRNPWTGVIDPTPKLGPRYYFKLPWEEVAKIFAATETVDMWTDFDPTGKILKTGPWPALDVPSVEGLILYMDATVRWHISASNAFLMYTKFPGLDYKEKVIFPAIRDIARSVSGKYSALDLYGPKRDAIRVAIKDALTEKLKNDPVIPDTMIIEDFLMRKIQLPVDFAKAVEAKVTAVQLLEKAEFDRKTKLVQANATAQAMVIEAQGMAQAAKIIMERFKMDEPTAKLYLTYLYIQAIQEGMKAGKVVIFIGVGQDGLPIFLQLPATPS